jgi:AAA+ ATPase superfamily predicted ATPase
MKQNPFIISGYLSPEYFCDREEETARMLNAIENGRHITLFSPRRMGKTGLIRHLFYKAGKKNDFTPVYLDIMATTSLREFCEVFGKGVLTAIGKNEALMKKILKRLSALRLKLTIDHLTGEPALSLDVNNAREAEKSLDTIFRYIAVQPYRIAIAIDEFQQIMNYPEKNLDAILRTHLQTVNNVCIIFSGSRKHILTGIFSSPDRPFYNITEMMEIGEIDTDVYKVFIQEKFSKGSISISAPALERIIEITGLHTFYVQCFCNRLYSEHRKIETENVDRTLIAILSENEPVYASYLNLLTVTQYRVLKAIAQNGGIENPLSKEFISKYDLGAASTVSQAIKSLSDKEFVFFSKNSYRLNDVFLGQWIIYKTA